MPPRVFISYSHDSRAHCDAVLALAQQLRRDGIAAELDQFHQEELLHWPRWCEEQMRPEHADFVLCVCTAEYAGRVEGRVAANVGKGVFWEGTLIYNELYDAKGNPRCVPVLLDGGRDSDIPRILRNWTWFRLDIFDVADEDSGYAKLWRLVTRQVSITPAAVGALPVLERRFDFMDEIAKIQAGVDRLEQHAHAHTRLLQESSADIRAKLEEVIAATRQSVNPRESLSPQQRYDLALQEVAFKHDLRPEQLRAAIDAWTHKVEADPQASPYDLALAEYKANHFSQAAMYANTAYEQAIQARVQATQDAIRAARLEGNCYEVQGRYDLALVAYRKGAALTDKTKDLLAWADGQEIVAKMLLFLAHHQEVEPILHEILAIREQWLGANHPNTATAFNNLATLLRTTNRLAEAEPLMRRALSIREQQLGANHPDTAIALNNLATFLLAMSRLAEAESLMQKALAIDEGNYGPEHPKVAIRLNNLAQLFQDTNRLAEAEPLMRRALAIDENSYGPEHPDIAADLNNLAQLLRTTSRLTEAEPLMRRALAIGEKNYGPEHPAVALNLNNLARLLQATSRLTEAEPLMRRALAIDEKIYGPEHPDVACKLNNLALLLQATNRLAEAEPLMRRALAIGEKSYGLEHPTVAIHLNNLAQLFQDTNRLAEAEPLMRRALVILLKFAHATGHEHPELRKFFGNYRQLLLAQHLPEAKI